jgi:predicted NUDIX family NTP pyrophosphohydrolase
MIYHSKDNQGSWSRPKSFKPETNHGGSGSSAHREQGMEISIECDYCPTLLYGQSHQFFVQCAG